MNYTKLYLFLLTIICSVHIITASEDQQNNKQPTAKQHNEQPAQNNENQEQPTSTSTGQISYEYDPNLKKVKMPNNTYSEVVEVHPHQRPKNHDLQFIIQHTKPNKSIVDLYGKLESKASQPTSKKMTIFKKYKKEKSKAKTPSKRHFKSEHIPVITDNNETLFYSPIAKTVFMEQENPKEQSHQKRAAFNKTRYNQVEGHSSKKIPQSVLDKELVKIGTIPNPAYTGKQTKDGPLPMITLYGKQI